MLGFSKTGGAIFDVFLAVLMGGGWEVSCVTLDICFVFHAVIIYGLRVEGTMVEY